MCLGDWIPLKKKVIGSTIEHNMGSYRTILKHTSLILYHGQTQFCFWSLDKNHTKHH